MNPMTAVDTLIIGAGPAGLQLAYFLERAGRDYLVLERADVPGAFFRTFPRHRMLISINKWATGYDDVEVNLRWDWNSLLSDREDLLFPRYTRDYFPGADEMVRYLADYAEQLGLKVRYGAEVERVARAGDGEGFVVECADGNGWSARRVVVATGFCREHLPPIPGLELAETYGEVSVDPDGFTGQEVLVIGKGNSGFETADNLIPTTALVHVASPSPLSFAWKTHFVGHLRAVNNNFLDTYQLKSQNAVLDATIERIRRTDDGRLGVTMRYSHAGDESEELVYDRVIACTGFAFDDRIFAPEVRPRKVIHDRFPELTSAWEAVGVPGLYFAGTLTQVRDFKKATSGFIHGFRYNCRALFRLLEERYEGVPWPSRELAADAESITAAVLERINRSSALWQQFGFLGDVVEVSGGRARYYEEMPHDLVHDGPLGAGGHYYVVTLEFGKVIGDPFHIERDPRPDAADRSTFLHPVIRRFDGSELLAEQHLLEDLYGEWRKPVHVEPLTDFFTRMLEVPEGGAVRAAAPPVEEGVGV